MSITIDKILISSANEGTRFQKHDGSMPEGMNGPWQNMQTPVRNTAHWSLIFNYAYSETKNEIYYNAMVRCIRYLLSNEARPNNLTFLCRKDNEKDDVNGLIGQAWVLEALIKIGRERYWPELLETAEEVFLLHKFDGREGLWNSLNTEGNKEKIVRTINQQIWFCAIGTRLLQINSNEKIKKRIDIFLDKLPKNIQISPNGLIRHLTHKKGWLGLGRSFIMDRTNWKKETYLSIGYQAFNLIGLSSIYMNYPHHRIWKNNAFGKKIKKSFNLAVSSKYLKKAVANPYCFSYNINGVETRYAFESFNNQLTFSKKTQEKARKVYQIQIDNHLENYLLKQNTIDEDTLMARAYEFIYLKEKM